MEYQRLQGNQVPIHTPVVRRKNLVDTQNSSQFIHASDHTCHRLFEGWSIHANGMFACGPKIPRSAEPIKLVQSLLDHVHSTTLHRLSPLNYMTRQWLSDFAWRRSDNWIYWQLSTWIYEKLSPIRSPHGPCGTILSYTHPALPCHTPMTQTY